ncbi:MAG TPA: hypothetical protein DD473_00955, partial [Planctomycetaceae bacterium]|nr:hypothetical protein [Planctomycetaceae bacterium]
MPLLEWQNFPLAHFASLLVSVLSLQSVRRLSHELVYDQTAFLMVPILGENLKSIPVQIAVS